MKKKPKLLTSLMGGGKRRHHVAAFVTQEGEWNRHEPNTGFARVFIAMLILHVFIIGGIILSDFSSSPKSAPKSPAAVAMLTKSSTELSSASTRSAPSPSTADAGEHERYTVGSGDSLPTIVARFGVDKDELIQLNHLDQNGQFSAGTVLLIPTKKVTEPLQIVAARNLPTIGTKPPTDNVDVSEKTEASTSTSTPETTSAETSTTTSTNVIASSDSPPVPSATPISSGADGTPTLVPLPEIPKDTTADTASISEADATPVAEKKPDADAPPEATHSPEAKPAPAKKTTKPEKPAQTKPAVSASKPKPVPTPHEMMSRPITKPDSATKTPSKPTPTKGAGGSHIMAKGETLYRLSGQYGVSVESLMKANNIKDASKLRDGTKLVIPAK